MFLKVGSSFSATALHITAVVNVILAIFTLRKHLATQNIKTYTYLNRDYPLETPMDPLQAVEMTFHESARFSLSEPSSVSNWDALVSNQFGLGFHHLGPYHFRFISTAYHALHCVRTMQQDLEKPRHLEEPSPHYFHCLFYLRQIFLCNADMTLEDGDFMSRNFTTDRVGQTRRCRDWSKAAEWIGGNFREWAEFNGIELG